jgi:hypothetical protein
MSLAVRRLPEVGPARRTSTSNHGKELSGRAEQKLREHFQVVATGQPIHEQIVGAPSKPGAATVALHDALNASRCSDMSGGVPRIDYYGRACRADNGDDDARSGEGGPAVAC